MQHLIDTILSAKSSYELFPDEDSTKSYRRLAKVHPDICKEPKAEEAFLRLQTLYDIHKNGSTFVSDLGTVTYYEYGKIVIKGKKFILETNLLWWNKLRKIEHLIEYLPKEAYLEDDETLIMKYNGYLRNPSELKIPMVHINWMISRMLEFVGFCFINGIYHNSMNPKAILINPVTHSVIIINYLHCTLVPNPPTTAYKEYASWYKDKDSVDALNFNLIAKTAISLMGDKTGIGNKLLLEKEVNKVVLKFLQERRTSPIPYTYLEYKKMLLTVYENKFIKYEI